MQKTDFQRWMAYHFINGVYSIGQPAAQLFLYLFHGLIFFLMEPHVARPFVSCIFLILIIRFS